MPYLHETLARQKALAEGPTLGNLHPDARDQAIARAGIADAEAMQKRMDFLHSSASVDADGYEWGVFQLSRAGEVTPKPTPTAAGKKTPATFPPRGCGGRALDSRRTETT